MGAGTKYKTLSDAQKYADTFDDATGATAVPMKMTDPNTDEPYWVVVPSKPIDQEQYYREAAEVREAQDKTGKNMGGVVIDELGYRQGGLTLGERGPVKYSSGGAVKGKKFAGTF